MKNREKAEEKYRQLEREFRHRHGVWDMSVFPGDTRYREVWRARDEATGEEVLWRTPEPHADWKGPGLEGNVAHQCAQYFLRREGLRAMRRAAAADPDSPTSLGGTISVRFTVTKFLEKGSGTPADPWRLEPTGLVFPWATVAPWESKFTLGPLAWGAP